MKPPAPQKGILISFDGIDSSGKETQVKLLVNKLRRHGYTVRHFQTPDYELESGRKLKRLFQGIGGSWNDLSWQKQMRLLASNRAEHKEEVINSLKQGHIVVYDRYVPSSIAHITVSATSASNRDKQRDKIQQAVKKQEYQTNGMPKETLSIFLDVAPPVAFRLLEKRKIKKIEPDEQTDRIELQQNIYKEYRWLARHYPDHYQRIQCLRNRRLLQPGLVADCVWHTVNKQILLLPRRQ